MRFGLFYDIRNPARWARPWPQFAGETLDHMAAMDELGFEALNITEHHFDDDGYCPSLLVWNAAAAARTKRARLGQEIMVLPLHHPVQVAEDIAAIDNISNGRVWMRVGQGGGVGDSEYDGYGVPRSGSRYREQLEIIKKCFTEDRFDYDGRHFQLKGVHVMPKPVQQPHPPIFVVATPGAPSIDFAVRNGFGAITATGGPQGLPDEGKFDAWHEAWAAGMERGGRKLGDLETSNFMGLFVTEDPERDWAKHREGVLHALQFYGDRGTRVMTYDKPEDIPNWQNLFLTPDDAVKYLRRLYGIHAPDWLILWANRPGMTYDEASEHHRLFLEKVAPQLADL